MLVVENRSPLRMITWIMGPSMVSLSGLLLPAVILLHLYWAPYTKVEESFNIQAIHDIVAYGVPLRDSRARLVSNYDHMTFTGPVPRTFVGAITLAQLTWPFCSLIQNHESLQFIARGILGLGNGIALMAFQDAINQAFGRTAAVWFALLQTSQFHVMYYASRTLPNMFAFGFTTLALRYMILSNFGPRARRARRNRLVVYLLTLSGIVFRSEIAILLAVHVVLLVLVRGASIRHVVIPGLLAAIIGLSTTMTADSFFWQKFPLWPEFIAFKFNTIDGKASEWGVSPWYFYFVNSIPRLIMNPVSMLVCIPFAVSVKSTRRISLEILTPLLSFAAIYSFLPHKEWRFIIYVIPGLTAVASAGASWIWTRRSKSVIYRVMALLLVVSTLASFAASCGLLAISSLNYPGAEALQKVHKIADRSKGNITIHMDNLSCQTGVTRFLQKPLPFSSLDTTQQIGQTVWTYDKTEDPELLSDSLFWQGFDYTLAESPESAIGNWEVVDVVKGYAGIGLTTDSVGYLDAFPFAGIIRWIRTHITRGRWPVIKMEPKISILKRQDVR